MSSRPDQRRRELRASLLAVAETCPFHQSNPEDCPLFGVRKMTPPKRRQWFNALSEEDLAYLATYHHVCLTEKVTSPSAGQPG